jgi:hypothetical protein
VLALLKPFLAISLLRAAPQDLPASSMLLTLAVLVYAAVGVALSVITLPWGSAVLASLLDTVLLVAFGYTALSLRGLGARFIQTATALTGSLAVLGIVSLPLTAWLYQAEIAQLGFGLPLGLLYGMLFWNVMVIAHIFRHALNASLGMALAISVAYLVVSLTILNALFAPVVPATPSIGG